MKRLRLVIPAMVLFAGVSVFFIKKPWVQALVAATVLAVAIYIATRKTKVVGPSS